VWRIVILSFSRRPSWVVSLSYVFPKTCFKNTYIHTYLALFIGCGFCNENMFPEILRFIIEEGVVSQCSHIPFLFPSTCIHRTQIAIFLDMHLLLLTSPKQTYNQQAPSRSATPSQPMLSTPRASSPPPPVMQLRQVCVYLNSFLYVSSHPSVCLCVLVCVRVCVCANSTG